MMRFKYEIIKDKKKGDFKKEQSLKYWNYVNPKTILIKFI